MRGAQASSLTSTTSAVPVVRASGTSPAAVLASQSLPVSLSPASEEPQRAASPPSRGYADRTNERPPVNARIGNPRHARLPLPAATRALFERAFDDEIQSYKVALAVHTWQVSVAREALRAADVQLQ